MNILQINTTDSKGGAAKIAYQLKNELQQKKNNVKMMVKIKTTRDNDIFNINNFYPLSALSKKILKKDIPNYIFNKIRIYLSNDIQFFPCLNIFTEKTFKDADIIHCHNLHGGYFNLHLLKRISALKPLIWTLHDMWAITGHCAHSLNCEKWQTGCGQCPYINIYPSLKWDNTKKLWQTKQKIYKNCKLNIVVPSLWLKNKIEKSILKEQNINLIYNGIDEHFFSPANKIESRKKLGMSPQKKIIMFIADGGKKNIWKGWQYIKEVINYYKNQDVLFLCIGGNDINGAHNVKYIPYIEEEEKIAEYYRASDIFLFASIAENFPLTILEAMACGLPIVSFNVGGIKEAMIDQENGYIAEYKNTNDLINGVKYIFNLDNNQIENIKKKSAERIKNNFTLKIMTDKYLSLYEQYYHHRNPLI